MQKTDPSEAAIVLIGTTGTGKSTFVHLLTGDDRIHIGHDLESQTSEVHFASYITEHGQHVKLVDTPGFDDSHKGMTDTDILERIADFLLSDGGQKLNGLIYMHRISDPRMDYTAKKSLEIFSELCGERNFANVRIVTIDWDGVDENEGENREKALSKRYFKDLIDGGAKMCRHGGELESAQSIVSELIQQPPVTLKIQEELNATGGVLGKTSAAAVIMREMKEVQKEHEMRMEALKDEMEQENNVMRDQLEAERRELVKRMAQVQEDSKRLEETRIARESHTPSSENVSATIPRPGSLRSRDRHPQGRETPSIRSRWELLPFVPLLCFILTKRHVKISGILLSFFGVLFLLSRGELHGMYRSWLYGGITWPPVSDRPSGGVWPDLIPDGTSRDEQATLGPVGDTSAGGQSEHPFGSGGTTRITAGARIGNIFSGGIPRTTFTVEGERKDDNMRENQLPGWWWPRYRITRPPVSHRPSSGVLPDSRRSSGVNRERGMPRTEIEQEEPYGSIVDGRKGGRIIFSKSIGDFFSDESPHTAVFVEDDENNLPGFQFLYPI